MTNFGINLKNGVSGAGPITKFDPSNHKTQFACEIKDFDAELYMDRKEIRKHDLYTQYAFASSQQAIEDSGLDLEQIDHDRVGVIWGAGIGGLETFFEESRQFKDRNATLFSVFYPKNDCQHCRWINFNKIWF